MGYFPFYIDIENKKCVVIGGGVVALRKIEKILPFNPKITVVAPEICKEIEEFDGLELHKRNFLDSDITNAFTVIAATDDNSLNAHIFKLCSEKNILINTVDDKEKCGFIFPALVKKENITVGISTEGKSPVYARFMRERIESSLDESCDKAIDILFSVRDFIKHEINTEEKRKSAFERILKLCVEDIDSVNDEKILEIIKDLK